MSFLAPWMLVAGVAAAFGVVALHLLSTRQPPARPLPTARFVPASDLRAVSRTSRPTDLLLLALRALAVLVIGAAFAQPVPDAPGPSVRRVVALEWTSALDNADSARARARAVLGAGDALVLYDTAARIVPPSALDTLGAPTVRRASLSPMLIAVRDAAATIARGADSVAVTVIGAFPADAWDDATPTLRARWPGRIEMVAVPASADTAIAPAVTVLPADVDDPLVAAAGLLGVNRGAHPLRVRRDAMTAEDSSWLTRTPSAVLLVWPRDTAAVPKADGVLAVDGTAAALVAPLARGAVAEGRVIARWRDGAPAATERAAGAGCVREVGIGLPESGDVTLRAPFLSVLRVLAAPCGGGRSLPLADSLRAVLTGPAQLAAAAPLVEARRASPVTGWLLVLALALLLVEQWWRRRASEARA